MSLVSLQVQTQVPDNSILPVNSNGKNIVLKPHSTWFKYHLLPNQTTWSEQEVWVGDLWGPQRQYLKIPFNTNYSMVLLLTAHVLNVQI